MLNENNIKVLMHKELLLGKLKINKIIGLEAMKNCL